MNISYHLNHKNCTGFTLIEVLVAAVVMSVGLLGLAGLQMASLKNTHSASMVSQASQLASSMADKIRTDPDNDNLSWPQEPSEILMGGTGTVTKDSSECRVDNDNNGYLIQIQWTDKNKEDAYKREEDAYHDAVDLEKIYDFCFYHEE